MYARETINHSGPVPGYLGSLVYVSVNTENITIIYMPLSSTMSPYIPKLTARMYSIQLNVKGYMYILLHQLAAEETTSTSTRYIILLVT